MLAPGSFVRQRQLETLASAGGAIRAAFGVADDCDRVASQITLYGIIRRWRPSAVRGIAFSVIFQSGDRERSYLAGELQMVCYSRFLRDVSYNLLRNGGRSYPIGLTFGTHAILNDGLYSDPVVTGAGAKPTEDGTCVAISLLKFRDLAACRDDSASRLTEGAGFAGQLKLRARNRRCPARAAHVVDQLIRCVAVVRRQ